MIRHPEPPPRLVPLRLAICMIGASLVLAVIGVSLVAWSAATARHHLAESFEHKVVALEAQVTAMCQSTPDPATCKPVTQTPIVLVVPSTIMATTTTTVPFPPSTLAPSTPAPANPPASAAQAPSPAPQAPVTTTTAPPPPTTTPPTTATPCVTLPVVGGCVTRASRSATRSTDLRWEALRDCESGGDYGTNTGNGYYGAYQFSLGSWRSVGGSGLPSDAPPDEQDVRAQILYDRSGAGQWPVCGKYL